MSLDTVLYRPTQYSVDRWDFPQESISKIVRDGRPSASQPAFLPVMVDAPDYYLGKANMW